MAIDADARARAGATVHRVLNNNVVITLDARGGERVLMGRGLGFQRKPGDVVDVDRVEKTFVLDAGDAGDRERQLLSEVPYPVLEAVTRAVSGAEQQLGRQLGRRFTIAVIDHVQFVLERLDQGLRIPAANLPELRVLHPKEFDAARRMTDAIAAALDRVMPPEEVVFLTMHLLNATRDEPDGTAALLFRRLQHVVQTVERGLGISLDLDSPGYARFIVHIQFLLQRLSSASMLRSEDSSFFAFARHSYPRSAAIADEVKAYIAAATGAALTDEELLYVIVHVERLATSVTDGDAGGVCYHHRCRALTPCHRLRIVTAAAGKT